MDGLLASSGDDAQHLFQNADWLAAYEADGLMSWLMSSLTGLAQGFTPVCSWLEVFDATYCPNHEHSFLCALDLWSWIQGVAQDMSWLPMCT